MIPDSDAIVVYVTYQGTSQSRFDRHYYIDHHLPLVMKAWRPYGLDHAAAFFPATGQNGTIAICECRFRDLAAADAAFGSAEASAVMADVHNFTDLVPVRARVVPL